MNEKKKRLIETGMKLFAQKGFHSTSIQEIADKSGVSKGAFYLHFDSKEELTLNIHKYYYQDVMDKVDQVKEANPPSKEALAKQLEVFLNAFQENKDFIIMHMRDNIPLGQDVDVFLKQMKAQSFEWTSENLLAIYGEEIKPHIVDATILLEGFLYSYFKWMVMGNLSLDMSRLSRFIVRRMNDGIQGMIQEEEEPQISFEKMAERFPMVNRKEKASTQQEILTNMQQKIDQLDLDEKRNEDLHGAIDVLLQEAKKDEPQPIIFQGMLAHFKGIPEVKEDCDRIARKLNITLF